MYMRHRKETAPKVDTQATETRKLDAIDLHLQPIALSGEYGTDAVQFYHDSVASYESGDDLPQWLRSLGLSDSATEFVMAGSANKDTNYSSERSSRLEFVHSDPRINRDGRSDALTKLFGRPLETKSEWETALRNRNNSWWSRDRVPTEWHGLSNFTPEGRGKARMTEITVIMAQLALEQNNDAAASIFAESLTTVESQVDLYFNAQSTSNQASDAILHVYKDLPFELEQHPALLARFKSRQIAEATHGLDPLYLAEEVQTLAHDERYFPYETSPCVLLFETGVALARAGLPAQGREFIQCNLETIGKYYNNKYSFTESATPDFLALYDFQAKIAEVTNAGLSTKEIRSLRRQVRRKPSPEAIVLLALEGDDQVTKGGQAVNDPSLIRQALAKVDTHAFHRYLLDTIDTYFPTVRLNEKSDKSDLIAAYAATGRHQAASDTYLGVRSNDRIESVKKLAVAATMAAWYGSKNEIMTVDATTDAKIDLLQSELSIAIKPGSVTEASAMWQRYDRMIRTITAEVAAIPDHERKASLELRLENTRVQLNSL